MTTTIILKILLIIIAVIVILLHFSVIVFVRGGTNSKFEIKVKYLWITLYPRKKKPKKPKKKRRKKSRKEENKEEDILDEALEESAEEVPAFEDAEIVTDEEFEDISLAESIAEDKPAETLSEESTEEKTGKLEGLKNKWEFIKPYIPPAWKYSRKFMKAIRIEDVRIQIESGKEDAAESATFYGKLQAALFNTLNLLAMIFTVRVKEANVKCLFNVKKLGADGEATIKVRPSTMIAIAFCLLFCAAKIFIPYKLKQRRARKKAEKEAKKRAAVSAVTEETA